MALLLYVFTFHLPAPPGNHGTRPTRKPRTRRTGPGTRSTTSSWRRRTVSRPPHVSWNGVKKETGSNSEGQRYIMDWFSCVGLKCFDQVLAAQVTLWSKCFEVSQRSARCFWTRKASCQFCVRIRAVQFLEGKATVMNMLAEDQQTTRLYRIHPYTSFSCVLPWDTLDGSGSFGIPLCTVAPGWDRLTLNGTPIVSICSARIGVWANSKGLLQSPFTSLS